MYNPCNCGFRLPLIKWPNPTYVNWEGSAGIWVGNCQRSSFFVDLIYNERSAIKELCLPEDAQVISFNFNQHFTPHFVGVVSPL